MDKGIKTVGTSVKQTTQTGESLKTITEAVNTISDINTQVANTIEEQSIMAEDINQNVVSIDNLARQSDEASTNIAAANEQLQQLADNLSTLIHQFKID